MTWMDLENIMLSEKSQTQKATYWSPFLENTQKRQTIETESRLVVARGWREGRMWSDC